MLIEQVGELRPAGRSRSSVQETGPALGFLLASPPGAGDPRARALLVLPQTRLVGVSTPL